MKAKIKHEIRDPIHGFVKVLPDERKILDSLPLQRLRDISQLALTHFLYPSATHKRFEHSLGVMELATRIYNVITDPENVASDIRNELPEISNEEINYWRSLFSPHKKGL